MKTLILFLKITTFLLLIWMYQFFYNCDSYKTLIDKYILQTKNELKYERILAEGNTEGKEQTKAEECLEKFPLDNKENKCEDPVQYENPYDYWHNVINPQLWEEFNQETSGMDPKVKEKKWNVKWKKISDKKANELSSIFHRSDISEEEKGKLIDSVKKELHIEFVKFLCECKNEMRRKKRESESRKEMKDNKIVSESTKEMKDNKTVSESTKEMRDNKIESEYNKELRDNKTESESNKEMTDNKTESESMKEITENEAESKSKKEQRKNKINIKNFDFMKHLIFHKINKIYDNKN
ncbi:fam-g protein [Plasmodium gallinaceum]|uniref:Fam-g protein n=1 Tax=Plasmodium gallinaceum TaxID=5849 RepID=A0A1J1GSP8_PLAGA|nr:fam-g protein [Plasmodium gallinaceum]CRG95469.1 fam-g protein [Plasmodium gallinaceum]